MNRKSLDASRFIVALLCVLWADGALAQPAAEPAATTPPPETTPAAKAEPPAKAETPTAEPAAQAEPAKPAEPTAPAAPARTEDDGVGLDLDLAFESAYVFRGLVVFGTDGGPQNAARPFLAPSIAWSLGDTGLSVGYWGAYQIVGEDISDNIDGGLGAETDLYVAFEKDLTDSLSMSALFTAFLYPMADEEAAGETNPTWIEPLLGIAYSSAIDVGLNVSWFASFQEAYESGNYVYVNPTLGKTFELKGTEAELSAGFGYKVFYDDSDIEDNVYDVLLGFGVPLETEGGLRVAPSIKAAWTNLSDREVRDELVVWAGLSIGTSL